MSSGTVSFPSIFLSRWLAIFSRCLAISQLLTYIFCTWLLAAIAIAMAYRKEYLAEPYN
jgi:hypothetical protein